MCRILYGKLTQIDKQSHNSSFSTPPPGDRALFGHAQKYHDCSHANYITAFANLIISEVKLTRRVE